MFYLINSCSCIKLRLCVIPLIYHLPLIKSSTDDFLSIAPLVIISGMLFPYHLNYGCVNTHIVDVYSAVRAPLEDSLPAEALHCIIACRRSAVTYRHTSLAPVNVKIPGITASLFREFTTLRRFGRPMRYGGHCRQESRTGPQVIKLAESNLTFHNIDYYPATIINRLQSRYERGERLSYE